MTVHGTLRALFAPIVLLLGACDDTPPTVPEGFAKEQFTVILDYLGEDDVMDFWRSPAHANSKGRTILLGDGYMAHVWRPDFAEAWGIVTDFDEDTDPGCSGRGLRFVRCLKRHVDAGKAGRIVKEGDTYRARFEESLSGREPKTLASPTRRTRIATRAAFHRIGTGYPIEEPNDGAADASVPRRRRGSSRAKRQTTCARDLRAHAESPAGWAD